MYRTGLLNLLMIVGTTSWTSVIAAQSPPAATDVNAIPVQGSARVEPGPASSPSTAPSAPEPIGMPPTVKQASPSSSPGDGVAPMGMQTSAVPQSTREAAELPTADRDSYTGAPTWFRNAPAIGGYGAA